MQPFVKWAGGKRQIMDKLLELKPKRFKKYFEPFLGGGGLFLELSPKNAIVNDLNKDLIYVYKCLRNKKQFDKMLSYCVEHEQNHSEEYYYKIRNLDRNIKAYSRLSMPYKASRCLYLNKACFNGLYRVNSKGFFNVPSGKYQKVKCFDRANMLSIYHYFHKRKPIILNKDFALATKAASKGDFIYFDPPYDSEEKTSFTTYTKGGFNKDEQIRLRDLVKELTDKGVFVMVSNANTAFINEIYKGFNIHVIEANRSINSKGDARGKVLEVIITNY